MSLPPLHTPEPWRGEAASGQEGSVRDLLVPACPETLRLWSIFIGLGSERSLEGHPAQPPIKDGPPCLNTSCDRQLTTSQSSVL